MTVNSSSNGRLSFKHSISEFDVMLSAITDRKAYSQEEVLQHAAEYLFGCGFERMRFFQAAADTIPDIPNDQTLYLTWQQSREGAAIGPQAPGFAVSWEDADILRKVTDHAAGRLKPVCGSAYTESERTSDSGWVEQLDLLGRSWVDIPLYDYKQKFIGVIAVDWPGSCKAYTTALSTVLNVFGYIVGAQLAGRVIPVGAFLQAKLAEFHAQRERADDLVVAATKLFQENMGISSASVFTFDWSQQTLVRRSLDLLHRNDPAESEFEVSEQIHISNHPVLCSLAWNDPRYCRVVNLDHVRQHRAELVSPSSDEFHERQVGPVNTLMYAQVGQKTRRYQIRLINNAEHSKLPFLDEYEALQQFTTDLGPIVDSRIASQRLAALTDTLNTLEAKPPAEAMAAELANVLSDLESLRNVVILAHRTGDSMPFLLHGIPSSLGPILRSTLLHDESYTKLYQSASFTTLSIRKGSRLGEALRALVPNANRIGCFPFASGYTRGGIFIPLIGNAADFTRPDSPGEDTRGFISQLASALGQALESHIIEKQSEGALNALALVGHEMVTPIISLSEAAKVVVRVAQREASLLKQHDARPAPPSYYRSFLQQISNHTDSVAAAVTLGQLVGRQSNRHIIGVRRLTNLAEMIGRAQRRVRREVDSGLLLYPEAGIIFRDGSQRMSSIAFNMDRGLVETALANIYRNAVKYSVANKRPATIETRSSYGDGFAEVVVINRGLAIPKHMEEQMFRAFVRLVEDPPNVPRRGMGLGLFLGRSIATAHHGFLRLTEHVPIDGQAGTGVYRTSFTLRLSTDLPDGHFDAEV